MNKHRQKVLSKYLFIFIIFIFKEFILVKLTISGIAAETMNSYISVEQNKRVYYRGARFVRGRDEYLPIPNAQYNFSEGNYVQNPGYGKFN